MTDRHSHIIHAARTLIGRYGFAKTTMGDIATEAGVARQTVYNAFPGKSEILRAVVRLTGEETLQAVTEAWDQSEGLEAKLRVFHELGPIAWFELVCNAPDWADLLEGVHADASDELAALDGHLKAALSDQIAPFHAEADTPKLPLPELVAFFYSTSANAKHGVADLAELQRRLSAIRLATLALLDLHAT